VLPYNYLVYGHTITSYLQEAQKMAIAKNLKQLDFSKANMAAERFTFAGERVFVLQDRGIQAVPFAVFNEKLRAAEEDLLSDAGLPHRPWYKHTIFAPGEYTGYAAVVLPGVTEAMQDGDATRAQEQLDILTAAIRKANAELDAIFLPAVSGPKPPPAAKP
jgi:N-acetylated-alpha-linked acidic dipeptidase